MIYKNKTHNTVNTVIIGIKEKEKTYFIKRNAIMAEKNAIQALLK
jgi:hypothetical protein